MLCTVSSLCASTLCCRRSPTSVLATRPQRGPAGSKLPRGDSGGYIPGQQKLGSCVPAIALPPPQQVSPVEIVVVRLPAGPCCHCCLSQQAWHADGQKPGQDLLPTGPASLSGTARDCLRALSSSSVTLHVVYASSAAWGQHQALQYTLLAMSQNAWWQ